MRFLKTAALIVASGVIMALMWSEPKYPDKGADAERHKATVWRKSGDGYLITFDR